jgi:protein-S-isoprenylcysteine O-methyltransferase Ste14
MAEKQTEIDKLDQPLPIWFVPFILVYMAVVLSLLVFLPAGDWTWLEGWIAVVSLSLVMTISVAILNRQNPRVLRNRMRMKKEGLTQDTEKPASFDRFFFPIGITGFLGAIIVPALGHRFGWYTLPFGVALFGVVMMNLGMIIVFVALNQNAHASKILDIKKGQVLVDTGLYGKVRHPVYTGYSLMILFFPIALGSVWGLPLALLFCVSLIVRIFFEEDMLLKGMEGYEDYQSRVKYKLIPKIY